MLSVTRDSRNREIAANLAAQEIDLARDAANIFSLLDGSRNIVLNGETFTVTRTTGWVSNPNSAEPCGQGGGILKYKRIEIKVDWEHKRAGSDVVHANTVISPSTRINNPQLGTILVSVEDGDGNGSAVSPSARFPVGESERRAVAHRVPRAHRRPGLHVHPAGGPRQLHRHRQQDQLHQGRPDDLGHQDGTVAANNSSSASFAYDLRAQYQLAYYSSPAPFAKIPRDLDTTFVNNYGVTYTAARSASFTRTIDRFPWTSGYSMLAGKYIEATKRTHGCLSTNPVSGPTASAAVTPSSVPRRFPSGDRGRDRLSRRADGARADDRRQQPLPQVTTAPAGVGDPGCAIGMTYRTNKTASDTIWLALPYGTWKLESNPIERDRLDDPEHGGDRAAHPGQTSPRRPSCSIPERRDDRRSRLHRADAAPVAADDRGHTMSELVTVMFLLGVVLAIVVAVFTGFSHAFTQDRSAPTVRAPPTSA